MKRLDSGGGWPAIWYTVKAARRVGGLRRMYGALRSRNACKTCALGMGGQKGGMVNESGRFPEVCKKSIQAMAADMQGRIKPGFFDEFNFDRLARMSPRELEMSGRIVEPLYAAPGDKTYRPIDFGEAIDRIARKMRASDPDETFFYFSGRSSNEAGFLLQLFARLYGTNNVNNCSYYCHQASGVGLTSVTGSGTATVELEDVARCDLLVLIGANPASNHPRLMRTIVDMKRNGGQVVVINPLKELGLVNFRVPSDVRSLLFGSKIADLYIQPHIGGDIALLTGVAKALLARDMLDHRFIEQSTDGWSDYKLHLDGVTWLDVLHESGVDRSRIDELATLYAASRRTVFAWTMGVTHHEHGVANVQSIGNLALMRGMLGKPGAGLLPLRGHSNVQGIGSIGATPALKEAVLDAFKSKFGLSLPTTPGLDTLGCVERAREGRVRLAWHLGGNLYGSNPDSTAAGAALRNIDTTVFLSTTLNTGHVHGRGKESIILPVLARDEEPEATTQESMFNYVRLSEGGKPRHAGPRSEVSVIAAVAEEVLDDDCPLDFKVMQEHASIRTAIAAVVPGYKAIGQIDKTRQEFYIDGRLFHTPRFPTENGRARFQCAPLPSHPHREDDQLRLMTIRSEGQFNTVVYEEEDVYRQQERRDVLMMNQTDAGHLGFAEDDRVNLSTTTGTMEGLLVRFIDIAPGNAATYYPEANVLIPASSDPESRTPAFKHVLVRVEKSGRLRVTTGANP